MQYISTVHAYYNYRYKSIYSVYVTERGIIMEQFTGKVWVLGDDIDTDIIIPTEYLALPTVEDMKQYI